MLGGNMDKVEFLRNIGVKATKEIQSNPKIRQIVNYIKNNDITDLTNCNYINEEKFLYFITNMKSANSIIEVLNNDAYLLNFNYDYKELVKFFNIYNPKKIDMIGGSVILADKEYLKYATIEWTQDIFSKSELIIKLYKDKVEFEKNPYNPRDIEYISAFEQNLRVLVIAKKQGRLEEVIRRATNTM